MKHDQVYFAATTAKIARNRLQSPVEQIAEGLLLGAIA